MILWISCLFLRLFNYGLRLPQLVEAGKPQGLNIIGNRVFFTLAIHIVIIIQGYLTALIFDRYIFEITVFIELIGSLAVKLHTIIHKYILLEGHIPKHDPYRIQVLYKIIRSQTLPNSVKYAGAVVIKRQGVACIYKSCYNGS